MSRKKDNQFEESLPIKMIKSFNMRFPGILGSIEQYSKQRKCSMDFQGKVFFPREFLEDWVRNNPEKIRKYPKILDDTNDFILSVLALITWSQSGQVLDVNEYLGGELIKHSIRDSAVIPMSIFDNLPYNEAYVDLSACNEPVKGFFYWYDYIEDKDNPQTYKLECLFYAIMDDNTCRWLTYFPCAGSISEFMLKYINYVEDERADYNLYAYLLSVMLSVLFYLSAANRELSENKKVKYNYKPAANIVMISEKNVKHWDVGETIGVKFKRIREAEAQIIKNGEYIKGSGRAKSPHTRRGHLHHFWIGKKGSPTRQLIYHILAPIPVNGGNNKDHVAKHDVVDE